MKKIGALLFWILCITTNGSVFSQQVIPSFKAIDSTEALADKYFERNDFKTAYQLYQQVLEKRIQVLKEGDPIIVKSLTKMAQVAVYSHKLDLATHHMDRVSKLVSKNTHTYNSLKPMIAFVHGKINEAYGSRGKANQFYSEFLRLSKNDKNLLQHSFYVDALTEISVFYAFGFDLEKAFSHAHKALELAQSGPNMNTYIHLKAIRNIANIYFGFSNYKKGLEYSEKGLQLFYQNLDGEGDIQSQVRLEKIIPYLIWINVKSKYYLNYKKDEAFLSALAHQMDAGIRILEKNKAILLNPEDISVLFDHYGLYFSFAKQLHLDLYIATNDNIHLKRLVQIHESVLYSKIRKRLNMISNLKFDMLPDSIALQEQLLKSNLEKSVSDPNFSDNTFKKAEKEWSHFLKSLKTAYPQYHKLQYASIEQDMERFDSMVSSDETVVRYLYVEKKLYALVCTKDAKDLVPIPYINIAVYNEKLKDYSSTAVEIRPILNTLYHYLGNPIAPKVKTKNVTIIPDGALFNINFDILTKAKIKSFKDLGSSGLLSKHRISYSYSLFVHNNQQKLLDYDNDFVAFAPEFDANMKSDYEMAIKDSTHLDKSYLTFLPQPFNSELAKKFGQRYQGTYFLNKNASKSVFTKKAGEHKIIHIGTHAESNNTNPELSRLVFAKNVSDSTSIDDNYLYTYEIYNQNLNSNLAILTACETGKPSYQPGEGMISLAHAFNYAGSESILTSLWQIDEQSSTQILEYFYKYLEENKPKDEALRLAKLDYLESAEGRTLHPQYWAGLVLMGNTSPIALATTFHWWAWALLSIIIGSLIFFLLKKRKASKS